MAPLLSHWLAETFCFHTGAKTAKNATFKGKN